MTGLSHYLMANPVLTLLFICHFLSDFHLQSQTVADKKEQDSYFLKIHLFWVALPLFLIFCIGKGLWLTLLLVLISHACIDFLKPYVRKLFNLSQATSFAIDQILHLGIIFGLSTYHSNSNLPEWCSSPILLFILFLLLISKPTNVAFRIFFRRFQPEDVEKMDTIPGAGATIGFLERLAIGICIFFGQFASIGLIFTAKSIARYNKISESPAFAEYYLIGSLFSIISALLAAGICLL
ncbi:DUF3307 domain-containing protein [Streptococcus caprae]|uniref:DUF3307 domain-containing protein n=1 Tax=Streptococcus caprae TaxID=1640501 RepID=A0ABV8CYM8_9STRE